MFSTCLLFKSDLGTKVEVIYGVVCSILSLRFASERVEEHRPGDESMTTYLGYCRVSTEKQSLDSQLAALKPFCGDKIWQEKKSGMSQAGRNELTAIVAEAKRLKEQETEVVICCYSLSRLGRRVVETVALVEELQKSGIGFKSTSENIDTTSAMGRCFFNILASLAQMEAEVISERTIAGLQAKKAAGVKLGPKPGEYSEAVMRAKCLIQAGRSVRAASREVGMSNSTLLRLLRV
jgi:DNA invertase Pin-like site-specific DNA recombinase